MNQSSIILLVLAFIMCSYAPSSMCRELKIPGMPESRKHVEEDKATCWDSLFELRSCTGEIALFMLNGETYLGQNCCGALRTIQAHCWPSMLGSVGINSQETDVLMGYCDAGGSSGSAPRPPLPPPPPSPRRWTFPIRH